MNSSSTECIDLFNGVDDPVKMYFNLFFGSDSSTPYLTVSHILGISCHSSIKTGGVSFKISDGFKSIFLFVSKLL
jgi:hypothetical protein